jgi:hypothetical protein
LKWNRAKLRNSDESEPPETKKPVNFLKGAGFQKVAQLLQELMCYDKATATVNGSI